MPNLLTVFLIAIILSACGHSPPRAAAEQLATVLNVEREGESEPPLKAGFKALLDRGYARYRQSDFAGALQQWEPVWVATQGSEPPDAWMPSLLSYCYLATGQYKKALSVGEQALRLQPHSPIGYHQTGVAFLWLGKNREAEEALRRALEFEEHAPDTFFYLGLSLFRQGKKKEAEIEFTKGDKENLAILASNPSDFTANYGLAHSYLYRNLNTQEAWARITAARRALQSNAELELTPDKNLYLHFYLPLLEGMYLNRQKQHRKSVDTLLSALKHSPSGAKADLAEIYYFLGLGLKELGQLETSKEFLAKSVELDPHGPYSTLKAF